MALIEKENTGPTKPVPWVKVNMKGMYLMFHYEVVRKLTHWKKIVLRNYVQAPCRVEVTTSAFILSPASMHLFRELTSTAPNCTGFLNQHRGNSASRSIGEKLRSDLLFKKCKVQIRKSQVSPLWFGFCLSRNSFYGQSSGHCRRWKR